MHPPLHPKYWKNIGFDTWIVWIRLRLYDLPSVQYRPLIVFITLRCFFWLAVAARLHGMRCAMPPWVRQARLVVWHWRSDHHLCVYRVQNWASLSLDDFTLINILQKSSIFTLEQIWTFLLSSSSWCLSRTLSAWHFLLHLEHSSFERTPSALIPFVVTEIDILRYQLLRA